MSIISSAYTMFGLLAVACASVAPPESPLDLIPSGPAAYYSGATHARQPLAMTIPLRRRRDRLTADEIAAVVNLQHAYVLDVIMRLRREFLEPTALPGVGGQYLVTPVVFVNDLPAGGTDVLKTILAEDIAEIRYVRTGDAMRWYGPRYQSGLICLVTKS